MARAPLTRIASNPLLNPSNAARIQGLTKGLTAMPIKDDTARRAYFRDYMRRRRAGEQPVPKTPSEQQARIQQLEAEVMRLRARVAELETPRATPKPAAAAKRKANEAKGR